MKTTALLTTFRCGERKVPHILCQHGDEPTPYSENSEKGSDTGFRIFQ